MIIDTNGFEIGDEVWYVYKNCKYYVSCGRICKLIITQSYNDRTKLNIMVQHGMFRYLKYSTLNKKQSTIVMV